MRRWNVPVIWPGKTVFIIGGGPSLTISQLDFLKGQKSDGQYRVLGINKAYQLGNWVDVVYLGDEKFYNIHRKKMIQKCSGLLVSTVTKCERDRYMKLLGKNRSKRHGISTKQNAICWNKNSGCAGINLAYLLGAKRIVLLGFDMSPQPDPEPLPEYKGGKSKKNRASKPLATHWHEGYPEFGRPSRDETGNPPAKLPYHRYLKVISAIAKDAERLGIEIIDCSLNGEIKAWPKRPIEDVIKEEVARCQDS